MQISLCISTKFLKLKTKKEKEKEKKDLSTTTGHLSWKLLGKKKKSKLDIDLILKKKKDYWSQTQRFDETSKCSKRHI